MSNQPNQPKQPDTAHIDPDEAIRTIMQIAAIDEPEKTVEWHDGRWWLCHDGEPVRRATNNEVFRYAAEYQYGEAIGGE